ncbi:betaine--homocysteine S-methyltransferase 1 [Suncus etruscus]|uniref:betaine--homocysteine S-methyltransferase 1 n=1 Tax=Suncus etruscus TaxID=109475 RepID=UPI00210F3D30|nr:betaine--homocysteine S-methyltransferase 1 [Suncus etruscus]
MPAVLKGEHSRSSPLNGRFPTILSTQKSSGKGWWACSATGPALDLAEAGETHPAPKGDYKEPEGPLGSAGLLRRRRKARSSLPHASVLSTCLSIPKMAPVGGKKAKKGILERLNAGEVVIGDGGFVFALEKRGYVKAGPWTPEATVEHPEAVRQLHREFLRAGSNVMQTFTFYASEDKLENRGNYVAEKISGQKVNEAACDIARQVADEGDALVAGGVSQTPSYLSCKSETEVKKVFQQQLEVFLKKNVDFLIAEYFEHVEEAVWAVEALKASGKPVAASMCIGPEGDLHGVSPGECAVRLVKAGAAIVGVNCHFDPAISLQTVKLMKEGLEAARLKAHLMAQPLAYHTPDCSKQGFIDLPEFPFGLEPRVATRWDIQKYARDAYNLGVRFIGGCCGFEPYHIRAIAEELAPERGFLPPASEKHGSWGSGLDMHTKPWIRARARKEYWQNLRIASGRPYNPSMSKPDAWGVTKGTAELMQQKEATTDQQLRQLFEKQKFKSAQ